MTQIAVQPIDTAQSTTSAATSCYCSFCLKSENEIKKLVDGHGRIFICDECIALCNDYLSRGTSDREQRKPIKELPADRLLTLLRPIQETIEGKSNQLQLVVEALRDLGVSWANIGEALGVSRQSAWERFSSANVR
jgi:epoxyqueuosine reductase QueG